MNTFWRILQLTVLAFIALMVSISTLFLIRLWDGGLLERWQTSRFTGNLSDDSIAIELASLPAVLAVFACWGIVRLFRLRSVHNEIEATFRPILIIVTGYARFALIIISIIYLLLGHGRAAAIHLAVSVVLFALFYRRQRAKERAIANKP
jgi:hypothetical protein